MLAAAAVVVIAGVKAAQDIVLQILAAAFISTAVAPPIFFLKGKGLPFPAALALVMAALMGAMASMAGVVGASFNDFRRQVPLYQQRFQDAAADLTQWLGGFGIEFQLDRQVAEVLDPGRIMSLAAGLFAGVGGLLADSFLILIMVIFLLLEAADFPSKLEAAFGDRGKTVQRFQRLNHSVTRYLVIKTWLSLATGALAATVCAVFGLDFALLWGLLAFLLNYVPNIGSIVAAAPPVLLAALHLGLLEAALILAAYVLINNVVGNVVEPRLMGQGLGLSTFVVVVSLVFWGWVLGAVGMLLSVPLTMAVKIAMEGSRETRWIAILLGSGADAVSEVAAMREASAAAKEPYRRTDAKP